MSIPAVASEVSKSRAMSESNPMGMNSEVLNTNAAQVSPRTGSQACRGERPRERTFFKKLNIFNNAAKIEVLPKKWTVGGFFSGVSENLLYLSFTPVGKQGRL